MEEQLSWIMMETAGLGLRWRGDPNADLDFTDSLGEPQ